MKNGLRERRDFVQTIPEKKCSQTSENCAEHTGCLQLKMQLEVGGASRIMRIMKEQYVYHICVNDTYVIHI